MLRKTCSTAERNRRHRFLLVAAAHNYANLLAFDFDDYWSEATFEITDKIKRNREEN